MSCADDADQLIERSVVMGCSETGLYWAPFLSLRCATYMDHALTSLQANGNVRILNPRVSKEKVRLSSVLRGHCNMLRDMALKVQDEVTVHDLIELRCKLAYEHERCVCLLECLVQMKMDALDRLLLLVLVPDAASADLVEGLWLLEHHRASDYSIAVHPEDGTISWSVIENMQQSIKERLGNKLPRDDTLVRVRANLLGVFGRYHFESKFQSTLQNTRAAIERYMLEPASKDEVIKTMKAQIEVLQRLINKRSLVGCYPINLPGEQVGPEVEDDGDGSQNGNASDVESSDSSNAYPESSISLDSIVSTDSAL